MAGATHIVAQLNQLLTKVEQAGMNKALIDSNDMSQVMRDSLCCNGPSPAIAFSNDVHWRVWSANAKRKEVDFVDPFGTDFLHAVDKGITDFYSKDKTGTWTFNTWTKRLQAIGDTWNCGIWAIWIQERWMLTCSETDMMTQAFSDWLENCTNGIPDGQQLRHHYHTVMQIASTAGQDGNTDLNKSREMSCQRMGTRREVQALHETYLRHVTTTHGTLT